MIKLATIGTSWITEQFIDACLREGTYELSRVYSRTLANAQTITEKFSQGLAVDDLDDLWVEEVDLVYIASPNVLHYQQAIAAINHGKHVIVEKPQFVSVEEWQAAHTLAQSKGVYLFEAIRHLQTQNYKNLKSLVDQKLLAMTYPFLGASFSIGQYSSKYDRYVEALENNQPEKIPNIFSPKFATGSLMDIGIYPIYVALGLFGQPNHSHYHALKGPNGTDLFGTVVLDYEDFMVTIMVSKGVHATQVSEIYLGDETILINNITDIDKVTLINKQNEVQAVFDQVVANPMDDEARYFADIMLGRPSDVSYDYMTQLSLDVAVVMEELRDSANITFPI